MTQVYTYKKKPVKIQAIQFDGKSIDALLWMDQYSDGKNNIDNEGGVYYINPADGQVYIRTLEGDHKVSVGDYIIRGIQGEFYPCKADIFHASYDRVNDD